MSGGRDVAEHVRAGHDVAAVGERPGRRPGVFADPVVDRVGRVVIERVWWFGGGRSPRQAAAAPQVELGETGPGEWPLCGLAPAVGAKDVDAHTWRLREVVTLPVSEPVVEEPADAVVGDPLRSQAQAPGPAGRLGGQFVIGRADAEPLVLTHHRVHVPFLDALPVLERAAQEVVVPPGPVEHRDVERLPQGREIVACPQVVALGVRHRQIVEVARQSGGSGQVPQRQMPGVEPQPVDVAAVGLVARPQACGLETEGAAFEQEAIKIEAHVAGRQAPQRRVEAGGGGPLREREVGLTDHADLAVAPRLRCDPVDRVVAIVGLVDHGYHSPSEWNLPRTSWMTQA